MELKSYLTKKKQQKFERSATGWIDQSILPTFSFFRGEKISLRLRREVTEQHTLVKPRGKLRL